MVIVVSLFESGWCVVGYGSHECMSFIRWLCMPMLIYCYTYIDMVIVVVNEVMVCG